VRASAAAEPDLMDGDGMVADPALPGDALLGSQALGGYQKQG
jgi:hypothetical protein